MVNITPRPFYPRERPGTYCTGGWVGPKTGLDGRGKSRPHTGIRSPERPVRSESLYRLSYPGPQLRVIIQANIIKMFCIRCARIQNATISVILVKMAYQFLPWLSKFRPIQTFQRVRFSSTCVLLYIKNRNKITFQVTPQKKDVCYV